jgi:hypothetical protein
MDGTAQSVMPPNAGTWAVDEFAEHGTTFYHGTPEELNPGDIVKPINPPMEYTPMWDQKPGNYAFATTDYNAARHYALYEKSGKMRDVGYIYKVSPVGQDWARGGGPAHQNTPNASLKAMDTKGEIWKQQSPEYISPSGWRVIKLVETVRKPEQTPSWTQQQENWS